MIRETVVIASEAKQSQTLENLRLLRRFAPRNDSHNKFVTAVVIAVIACRNSWAETPRLAIGLDQALDAAWAVSAQLRSVELEAAASDSHVRAQLGPLLPRLSLDGSYRYVTKIPQLSVAPGAPPISFTTHNSYSIGPVLSFNVIDGGTLRNSWYAAQAAARAKQFQADATRRQIRLMSRLTYFQTFLASEQIRLLVESYKVELAQYEDIRLRYQAGASSKIDLLTSHQQLLTRQMQVLQSRADLAASIRELASLTRIGENLDASLPLDSETAVPLPKNLEAPTLILSLEPAASSLRKLGKYGQTSFDLSLPQIQYLTELVRAAELTSKSLAGGHWPTLTFLAKTTLDYPNGPIKERINQNTIGANLSFPLFVGGSTVASVKEQKLLAQSNDQKREQATRDLIRDWKKAKDQVGALRAQQTLARRSVEEATELARLQYESYRAGRSRLLDVEDANLRVLQAKVDLARTDVQLLIQLANLESLSMNEGR